MTPEEMFEAGRLLMESGVWPPEGMELLRWDTTVNEWGIAVAEADSYEPVYRSITMWKAMVPGMFETTKTAPASEVTDAMDTDGRLLEDSLRGSEYPYATSLGDTGPARSLRVEPSPRKR